MSCEHCKQIVQKYKTSLKSTLKVDIFVLHTSRIVLGSKEHKEEKTKDVGRIVDTASALRNSKGGKILIHVENQDRNDENLEFFDEAVAVKLYELIEDGSLYTTAFKRDWFEGQFIVLTVTKGIISTSDFTTKIRTDHENVNPSILNIISILAAQSDQPGASEVPNLRGLQSFQHENRNIEVKRLKHFAGGMTDLVSHIWKKLKFRYNLTSFTKLKEGGSFYVGVREVQLMEPYTRKINRLEGLPFNSTDEDEFKEALLSKIRSEISVLKIHTGFEQAPDDLINIGFYYLENGKCVLEISVRFFEGIVFYDKDGPKAYIVDAERRCKMQKEEWLQKIKKFEFQALENQFSCE